MLRSLNGAKDSQADSVIRTGNRQGREAWQKS